MLMMVRRTMGSLHVTGKEQSSGNQCPEWPQAMKLRESAKNAQSTTLATLSLRLQLGSASRERRDSPCNRVRHVLRNRQRHAVLQRRHLPVPCNDRLQHCPNGNPPLHGRILPAQQLVVQRGLADELGDFRHAFPQPQRHLLQFNHVGCWCWCLCWT